LVLIGKRDRGFESGFFQQRVTSEPERRRSVALMRGHGDAVVTPSLREAAAQDSTSP
jgi:hypothetical protein